LQFFGSQAFSGQKVATKDVVAKQALRLAGQCFRVGQRGRAWVFHDLNVLKIQCSVHINFQIIYFVKNNLFLCKIFIPMNIDPTPPSTSLDANTMYALATVESAGQVLACLEVHGRYFPLSSFQGFPTSVAALFKDWERYQSLLKQAALQSSPSGGLKPEAVRVLAPLQYPDKILCAGANYFDHLAEMGMPGAKKEDQRLFFFMKPPRNAVVGAGATVHLPIDTQAFDWEIELAVVIGKRARNVAVESALEYVAAYTVAIDFSARDHNRAPDTFYKLDWVAGKGHDTCCPIGPRLVPASALNDPQNVALRLWVNGELKQNGCSKDMIFTVAEQIATASRIMTLDPGDLLLTGTPAGVGAPKQTFLQVGDQVDAEIEGIGRLSVTIQPSR
jgi:2-keto-4-pentenoate hydratase/2-oxohepta-3-ene-1,7-dioic acid hydratase in catechol pathway